MLANWVKAFRLRTLPLSFSSIITANSIAYFQNMFDWTIFALSCTTTLFLQILSNLANDYGDFIKGTDDHTRIGPERALQSGKISLKGMKTAIKMFVILSLISGLWLLFLAIGLENIYYFLGFFALGLASIWAAINYTAGSASYGYRALGDLFVFIFFGVVGVAGSYYLQTGQLNLAIIPPIISIGCFATGVLNINNLRDLEPDKAANKITIPVLIGRKKGKIYHMVLLVVGIMSSLFWVLQIYTSTVGLILINIAFLLITMNIIDVWKNNEPIDLNPKLRNLALSTFLFSVLFAVGLNL